MVKVLQPRLGARGSFGSAITSPLLFYLSALLDSHFRQGGAQAGQELAQIVVRPEMYKEHARIVIQHMIVDSRNIYAIAAQRSYDGLHFPGCQNEITGDGGLAAAQR